MSPQSLGLLALVVVVAGRFARKKKVTPKLVISGLIMALFLAVLAEWREDMAKAFAMLILVGVLLSHAVPVLENLGKAK